MYLVHGARSAVFDSGNKTNGKRGNRALVDRGHKQPRPKMSQKNLFTSPRSSVARALRMKYAEAHVRIVSVGNMNIEFICFAALVLTGLALLIRRVWPLKGDEDE